MGCPGTPAYEGTHYRFSGFIVEPSGLPRPVKVWVGGRTRRSLRRAAELGDAWMPFRLKLEELNAMLKEARGSRVDRPARGAPRPGLRSRAARRPVWASASRHDEIFRSYAAAGATGLSMRFRHDSRSHYVEQMEAAAGLLRELDG